MFSVGRERLVLGRKMESTSAWMEISFKVCSNQSKSRQKENDVLVKRLPATHLFMPCLEIQQRNTNQRIK